ncbi:CoA pyrophosphatase [Comamonas serinivorans]|uniref:CoA pyrophosphatase n=1 Tax=Comamonas serinivorans TaxID=1082851 RepID=A0A1Y0EQI1_9BURK|nr:CoA pyrophosphatase [Comamonas serinivorans]ARU05661.1 CoA pyrophosphatase [Comamonas serinivorans]
MSQVNVNLPAPLSRIPQFDARKVPVVAVDDGLPAIPAAALTPEALRRRFTRDLSWTPEIRRETQFTQAEAAPAAVLVPIVMRPQPMVLLTQRSTKLSKHSGQVAFPGGRVDPGDASIEDAALREALEEVGLDPARVEVIGALPSYTTGTAFVVTPVVGLVKPPLDLRINPQEVDVAFEVPLAFLMNPANHRHHEYVADGVRRSWLSMPYMDDGHERFVWGATAGMLRNLYRFLSAEQ